MTGFPPSLFRGGILGDMCLYEGEIRVFAVVVMLKVVVHLILSVYCLASSILGNSFLMGKAVSIGCWHNAGDANTVFGSREYSRFTAFVEWSCRV